MKRIKKHRSKLTNNRLLNPEEYLPKEEVNTLKQVFYLIILFLLFIFLIYDYVGDKNTWLFAIVELLFMVNIAISLDYSDWKNKIIFLLLVPYESFAFILIGNTEFSFLNIMNLIHIPVILYLMIHYYRKFKEYTETNGLGITIVLLFSIIFFSFILTMIVEGVTPLDSIDMVSNAFTSNGYTILGETTLGKVNSLLLVWSGYILSGVGTATLTAALLSQHFNRRIRKIEKKFNRSHRELKKMIAENNEEIKELIKENNNQKRENNEIEERIIENKGDE